MAGGNNVEEEFVATDGRILTAPADTPSIAPDSAEDSIDPAFYDHGLVDAAGVTRSQTATVNARYAWQNATRLRNLTTQGEVRIQAALRQAALENIELYHGTDMVDGQIVVDPTREYPYLQVIYDQYDNDGRVHREYFPRMQIDPASLGNQVALSGDGLLWDVTLVSTRDEGIGGHSILMASEFEGS